MLCTSAAGSAEAVSLQDLLWCASATRNGCLFLLVQNRCYCLPAACSFGLQCQLVFMTQVHMQEYA